MRRKANWIKLLWWNTDLNNPCFHLLLGIICIFSLRCETYDPNAPTMEHDVIIQDYGHGKLINSDTVVLQIWEGDRSLFISYDQNGDTTHYDFDIKFVTSHPFRIRIDDFEAIRIAHDYIEGVDTTYRVDKYYSDGGTGTDNSAFYFLIDGRLVAITYLDWFAHTLFIYEELSVNQSLINDSSGFFNNIPIEVLKEYSINR
jgi:hypothetical protein